MMACFSTSVASGTASFSSAIADVHIHVHDIVHVHVCMCAEALDFCILLSAENFDHHCPWVSSVSV